MGMPYLETSAKTASNVEPAFLTMAAEMKKKSDSEPFQKTVPAVQLTNGKYVKGSMRPCGGC